MLARNLVNELRHYESRRKKPTADDPGYYSLCREQALITKKVLHRAPTRAITVRSDLISSANDKEKFGIKEIKQRLFLRSAQD